MLCRAMPRTTGIVHNWRDLTNPKFDFLDAYETLFEYLGRAGYKRTVANKVTHDNFFTDQLDVMERFPPAGSFVSPKVFTEPDADNRYWGTVAGPLNDSMAMRSTEGLIAHIE